ncbi:DUF5701 family protein [Streptomyces viridochromogenes]|uniref:DUF5701 family protein n=1 Tax=Streptomyces viridochromogenes TaxID=1938 RepID=UPI00069E31DD|nr:DUF5701 family protein [Streptomyces viridochromogenes]KOG15920.1 hypothetical protein ADK36_28455 [Streptomyces viridochromogenes]KOG16710.1 hypothetical protein ADK35_26255 [Streptomyces viridochromogenes]
MSDTSSNAAPLPPLPPLTAQAEHLISLGVHELAGIPADELRAFAQGAEGGSGAGESGDRSSGDRASGHGNALLAVHPDRVPASALAPLLRRDDKPGFVVVDMPDVDDFTPDAVPLPDAPLYVVTGVDRGDHMANWSPEEALPALTKEDRTPLLLTEGIHWVLQQPAALERNRCFMTIGSRLRKANGTLDARTPAIWISNGTGRDGRERRNAPKVGWCWWGNRHTWLGFASATGRGRA